MVNKRSKFHPRISRVRLNPEQAVLGCDCYAGGNRINLVDPGSGLYAVSGEPQPNTVARGCYDPAQRIDWNIVNASLGTYLYTPGTATIS